MQRLPIPEWFDLTLTDGTETIIPISQVKRIDVHPDGCAIYVDKEPVVVQESFDTLRGMLMNHEAGGYSKR